MDAPSSSPVFVHQLGTRHFAHLRAIAEGVPIIQAAQLYLGIEHGHQAVTVHRQAVEAVKALALRSREKTWRLVGLAIPVTSDPKLPTLQAFAETTSWASEFSEDDLLEAYLERYPEGKKPTRRLQLRASLMATLARLEKLAVAAPHPQDPIAGWFDNDTATRLAALKLKTLGELNELVAKESTWHAPVKSIGAVKAQRIEQRLAALLPRPVKNEAASDNSDQAPPALTLSLASLKALPPSPIAKLTSTQADRESSTWTLVTAGANEGYLLSIPASGYVRPTDCLLTATNDTQAVLEWVSVRASSDATRKSYLREAARFMGWLNRNRGLSCLADLKAADCKAYIDFLGNIPFELLSGTNKRPKLGTHEWAPFRAQLTPASQKQSIVIIASMYTWLAAALYLTSNPWAIINKNIPGTNAVKEPTTKAFSEEWMEVILQSVERAPPSLETARARFIFLFIEAVGLRSSELLGAAFKDLESDSSGWFLKVTGKGNKVRNVFLPQQAVDALDAYLAARGLPNMSDVDPEIPLLSSARSPRKPIGYPALYATVKRWLENARASAELTRRETDHLKRASTHWLRHTFGTRAVEREVPYDVIQSQMGHTSIKTTMDTYSRAPKARVAEKIAEAFGAKSSTG